MTDNEQDDLPRLKCDPVMRTVEGWKYDLINEGHVCFSLDGERYFIYTNAPHTYVLNTLLGNRFNLGGDMVFHSEDELLDAKIFQGRSIRERLDEVLVCDQV
ncbi:MAG: hypothetical protein IKO40_08965 [Kiritimatiellae bacterium]|nr:hypothetical protein [Kiritimatiellia bacterium]